MNAASAMQLFEKLYAPAMKVVSDAPNPAHGKQLTLSCTYREQVVKQLDRL